MVYGSLATVAIPMISFFITVFIILLGAEVNAAIRKRLDSIRGKIYSHLSNRNS